MARWSFTRRTSSTTLAFTPKTTAALRSTTAPFKSTAAASASTSRLATAPACSRPPPVRKRISTTPITPWMTAPPSSAMDIKVRNGAAFYNLDAGQFGIFNNQTIVNDTPDDPGVFQNYGRLVKTGVTGTTTIQLDFANIGTDLDAGQLAFQGGTMAFPS